MSKIKECPYWIVNSEEEKKKIAEEQRLAWPDIGLKYPHIIGREPNFSFQSQDVNDPMKDYTDPTDGITYKYVKKN